MFYRLIVSIMFISLITGCSTTKQPASVNQMQIRLSLVENQLDEHGMDVMELKSSMNDLSTRIEKLSVPSKTVNIIKKTTKTASNSASKSDYQNILRVPIMPKEVQLTLQNAGYYNGAIDGKLGINSQKAIKDFQKDHDLVSDGIIGKKTWAELKNYKE